MSELFQEALRPYNLPITIFFGLTLLFWVTVILGAIDSETIEPDMDIDGDPDVDTTSPSFSFSFFRFFNVGDVPLTVILSVFALSLWSLSIYTNYLFNTAHSFGVASALLGINLLLSLAVTKGVTQPLRPLMKSLNRGSVHLPVVGRTCIVKTLNVTESFGQAEAEDRNGAPILINVRISPGQSPLKRGDQALVVHQEDQTYLIRKLES